MKRLGRWAFNILAVVSLAGCIFVSAVWPASYFECGEFACELFRHSASGSFRSWHYTGAIDGLLYYASHGEAWGDHVSDIMPGDELQVGYVRPRRSLPRIEATGYLLPPPSDQRMLGFSAGFVDEPAAVAYVTVPCWAAVIVSAVLPVVRFSAWIRRRRRSLLNLCSICA